MTATPAPALTDRTAATDDEFRDRVQAFDAAPYPAEVAEAALVETVARAIAGNDVVVGGWTWDDVEPAPDSGVEEAVIAFGAWDPDALATQDGDGAR